MSNVMVSNDRIWSRTGQLAAGIIMAGLVSAAHAALGGAETSVAQDGSPVMLLHRLHSVAAVSGVITQSVQTTSGVEVQEFSANGTVFAIRWAGSVVPDMSQLLGTYFPTYRAALFARSPVFRRAPVAVKQSGLVAHAGGHMRAYFGSAYAPALVPAGLDLSTLGVQP